MTRRVGGERSAATLGRPRPPLEALAELTRSLLTHPSGRGRRFATFARALQWQLGRMRGVRRALVRFGPMRLYCYAGYSSASSVLYFGLPEWNEMWFVLRYLRPGETLLDVGANIGAYSLLVATVVDRARVVAIEPDEDARRRLTENLALNPGAGVEVVASAVGAREGEARLTRGRDTLNRLALPGDAETVVVPMTTVDRLAATAPPALIKIDVEGAELEVLKGAEHTLRANPAPVLLLEMIADSIGAFGVGADEIVAFLAERGYRLFEYDAERRRCEPWDAAQPTRTGYVLAIRDLERVETLLGEGREGIEALHGEAPEIVLER